MPSYDSAFGPDFTFRNSDPWDKDNKRRRNMMFRGKKSMMPGAMKRALDGLPDDLQPDGKSLDESLGERNEKNKWEQARFEEKMRDEEKEDANEDEDASDMDAERMLWRMMAGSKPSDKRMRPQKWIDDRRRARRSES